MPLFHLWKIRRTKKRKRNCPECSFVALWFNLPTCDCDSSGFVTGPLFPFFRTDLPVPFCLADEHSVSDITIWTLNSPGRWRHVPAQTCNRQPYLHGLFSVRVIGFVKLSLYESCIRSSVPHQLLTLYLSDWMKKKLCVKSLLLWLHILWFSLC